MEVNFELTDNYALNYNGRHIDLHNNFNFVSYNYEITTRQLEIFWEKSLGSWVLENEYARLKLIHSNVFYLHINYDNKEYKFPKDDNCLSEITYFPSFERK